MKLTRVPCPQLRPAAVLPGWKITIPMAALEPDNSLKPCSNSETCHRVERLIQRSDTKKNPEDDIRWQEKNNHFEDESHIKNGGFCCYHISVQGCNAMDTMYMSRSHIIHIISQYILRGVTLGICTTHPGHVGSFDLSRLSASCPLHSVPLSFHQFSLKNHGSNELPWN